MYFTAADYHESIVRDPSKIRIFEQNCTHTHTHLNTLQRLDNTENHKAEPELDSHGRCDEKPRNVT